MIYAIAVKRSINAFAVRLGKLFYDKNFLISLISVLILLGMHIWCTWSMHSLTQEILCCQEKKLSKLVSVLSDKSIFCIDAKAITSDIDVQEVQSGIFE